tara:strand:- start:901 stop:1077 length:177 start_codon:yes stop_codon:yes gene_type:complete
MSYFQKAKDHAKLMMHKHSEHTDSILDLIELCSEEIEDGGSEEMESERCIDDINELIR